MRRRNERLARTMAGLCSLAVSLGVEAGQVFQWAAAGGGSWFAPANWTPSGVPSSDSDTATIGGTDPLVIEMPGANPSVGILNLTNPQAELRVRRGTTFALATGGVLNGVVSVGEALPGSLAWLKLGNGSGTTITGTGRLLMRAPVGDPTRVQVAQPGQQVYVWGKDITIEGAGILVGKHQIPGVVNANDAAGSALEFRGGAIDGEGTGVYTADGAVLRLILSTVTNARIETRNGGRLELSGPPLGGIITNILLNNAIVRGTMRSVLNTTFVQDTDFEGLVEVPAGTSVSFVGPGRVMNMTAQVGGGNSGSATLELGTGNPAGSGDIFLNGVSNPPQAILAIAGAELGDAWRVHGQGSIRGNGFINNTAFAGGTIYCPLRFEGGTIDGPGTLEAQGWLEFGPGSTMRNVRLISGPGGIVRVAGNAKWIGVRADTSFRITSGAGLGLENVVVNADVFVDWGTLFIGEGPTTINGDISLGKSWAQLTTYAGGVLAGSGRIDIDSYFIDPSSGSGIKGGDITIPESEYVTIPETRSIHGSGFVSGKVHILGPVFLDDPMGVGMQFTGDISGTGTNTIEISTGELIIADPDQSTIPLLCASFRIVGHPGSRPVRVGNDFSPLLNSIMRVALSNMDIDAEAVLVQRYVDLTDSIVHRNVQVGRGTTCRIFAGCRFEGDVTLLASTGPYYAPTVLEMRDEPPNVPRVVFANWKTDEPTSLLFSQSAGTFGAAIVGTGSISAPFALSGVLAPSDESTGGGPVGRLAVVDHVMKLTPETVYEADIVSTEKYDRIDAADGAEVNGTLRISAAPDFYPPPAFNFQLIRGSTTGLFTTVIGPPGFRTIMTYDSTGALARFEKFCGSDLNGDELVNEADFAIFCVGYDLMECSDPAMPKNCPGDFDRDGLVDDADFQVFVGAYAEMVCPIE